MKLILSAFAIAFAALFSVPSSAQWTAADTVANAFRDFNTPGVPASGVFNPQKSQIRSVLGRAQMGDWPARSDYISTVDPGTAQTLLTSGYAAPGDGGGALYKRAVVEPSHGGKFQAVNGSWWEIISDPVIAVEALGSMSDALAFSLATGEPLRLINDITAAKTTTTSSGSIILDGGGNTVTAAAGFIQHTAGSAQLNGSFRNTLFQGPNDGTSGAIALYFAGDHRRVIVEDNTINGFTRAAVLAGTNVGADQVEFRRLSVKRNLITNITDTVGGVLGGSYGVLSYDYDSDISFNAIDTVTNSAGADGNSYGIYVKGPNGQITYNTISNVTGTGEVIGIDLKGDEIGGTAPYGTGHVVIGNHVFNGTDASPSHTMTACYEIETDHATLIGNRAVGCGIAIRPQANVTGSRVIGTTALGDGSTAGTYALSGSISGSGFTIADNDFRGYLDGIRLFVTSGLTLTDTSITGGRISCHGDAVSGGVGIEVDGSGGTITDLAISGLNISDCQRAIRLANLSGAQVSNVGMPNVQQAIVASNLTNSVILGIPRTLQTTDATSTAAQLIPVGMDGAALNLRVRVQARITAGTGAGEVGEWVREATFTQTGGGTVSQTGTTTSVHTATSTNTSGFTVNVNATGSTARVQIAGQSGKTVQWTVMTDAWWG